MDWIIDVMRSFVPLACGIFGCTQPAVAICKCVCENEVWICRNMHYITLCTYGAP